MVDEIYAIELQTPRTVSYTITAYKGEATYGNINGTENPFEATKIVRSLKQRGLTVKIIEHVVYQTSDNQKRIEDNDIPLKKLEAIVAGIWIRKPKEFRVLASNDVVL